jgi:hypothetical protein
MSDFNLVMRGLDPRIHPLTKEDGSHRNSGLPELRNLWMPQVR